MFTSIARVITRNKRPLEHTTNVVRSIHLHANLIKRAMNFFMYTIKVIYSQVTCHGNLCRVVTTRNAIQHCLGSYTCSCINVGCNDPKELLIFLRLLREKQVTWKNFAWRNQQRRLRLMKRFKRTEFMLSCLKYIKILK